MLARGVGALLGGSGSPASFGPEQGALTLGLTLGLLRLRAGGAELRWKWRKRGQRRWGAVLRLSRLGLRVAVGLRSRDPFLLAAPGIVVGGVAYVVVDKRVGLLSIGVDLVLAVAALKIKKAKIQIFGVSVS